ncbi:nucleoside diphospahte hydrolase [Plasmodium vivax India VII]|uniref:Nucleoside diphospahte hydrolase, putative n=4 Tax=Plasmodium vivax TaxID=5855 RepID=A5K8C8_PLAVS|nr:nucleoside diphospahte hydrolase, putative [Plasmodium vivax]EDL44542.1 nucleoside diphospahte hydrolase, putative [Plasmodium vivax]KMZ79177.1 nucleoside diphospahte hydrolase [Plasmodium vivax India VII]KMZ85322.1 nucleoside diphospahte hydrolase [Plasmodium vivax Brazil I]KMZ91199.1 nucleoside diphospahte hydrolase [Plasmodium vivax Mauritania I]|eukprot:XP_001614269.1 nucleoside diphospahte hydrolase [Plasmodium vivax Sal-1]
MAAEINATMKDIINSDFEDNKDERVIIVDENNEFQELKARKIMRMENLWHRSTSIFVFTKIGEEYFIYVHKRSKVKDYCPSYYSIGFGGVVSENEDMLGNAVKELEEESGIKKSPEQLFDLGVVKCDTECSRSFVGSYVSLTLGKPMPFDGVVFIDPDFQTIPQLNEVEFITRIPLSEFDEFLQKEKFTVISKTVYNHFKDKMTKSALDEIYKKIN